MGMIIDGVYRRDITLPPQEASPTVENIGKQGRIQQMYRDHAHELIQPNNPDGSINEDFASYYPDDAKNHGHVPESEE